MLLQYCGTDIKGLISSLNHNFLIRVEFKGVQGTGRSSHKNEILSFSQTEIEGVAVTKER